MVGAREAGGYASGQLTGPPRAPRGRAAAQRRRQGQGACRSSPGSRCRPAGPVRRAPAARAPSTPPPPPRHVCPGPGTRHTASRSGEARPRRPPLSGGGLALSPERVRRRPRPSAQPSFPAAKPARSGGLPPSFPRGPGGAVQAPGPRPPGSPAPPVTPRRQGSGNVLTEVGGGGLDAPASSPGGPQAMPAQRGAVGRGAGRGKRRLERGKEGEREGYRLQWCPAARVSRLLLALALRALSSGGNSDI